VINRNVRGIFNLRLIGRATIASAALLTLSGPTLAQGSSGDFESLLREVQRQRAEVDRQAEELEQKRQELDALQRQLEEALAREGNVVAIEEPVAVRDEPLSVEEFVQDEPTLTLTGDDLIAADFPGSVPLFGTDTRMRIGGYIKADAIFDFDGHGNSDQFLLNAIAIDGTPEADKGGYFNAHARETRFNLDFRETAPGAVPRQAFLEVDLFTNPGERETFRLRHAYVVNGDFLIGRSWSTLSELRALPYMVDFAFGDSLFGGRTDQVRWQRPAAGGSFAVALEKPAGNSIANPLGLQGGASPRIPYLAARWSNDNMQRLLTVGTQIQQLRWDGEGGDNDDTALGWGVMAAGRWHLTDRAYLVGLASYSDGFSDAILALAGGGGSAVITPNGLETDRAITLSVGAAINWSETWSTNFHYAYLDRSGNSVRPGDTTESGGIGHINAIWRPVDKVRTGIELIWGGRTTLDGASGDGARLMGTFRYDFPVPYK
jgi:hypothetical protein